MPDNWEAGAMVQNKRKPNKIRDMKPKSNQKSAEACMLEVGELIKSMIKQGFKLTACYHVLSTKFNKSERTIMSYWKIFKTLKNEKK